MQYHQQPYQHPPSGGPPGANQPGGGPPGQHPMAGGGPRPYQPRYAAAVAGGGPGGGGPGGGPGQQQHPRMPQHMLANNIRGIPQQAGLFPGHQQQGQQPVYTIHQQQMPAIMIGSVSF